jgi:hypothetical protein
MKGVGKMNGKTILGLSILGAVLVSVVVGLHRNKIEEEAKQMEEDSLSMVRDLFKNEDFTK